MPPLVPVNGIQQTPQTVIIPGMAPTQMTTEWFNQRYWFTTLQMVEVLNPTWYREGGTGEAVSRDYPFMVELRHFIIRAGQHERLPGIIANVYLDGMSKILAQNDDKLGFMSDPNLMKYYYDQLIVDVEDMMPRVDSTPAYMRNIPQTVQAGPQPERAPWDSSMGERASDTPVQPIPAAPLPVPDAVAPLLAPQEPTKPSAPESHEFEQDGVKYKMVTAKDGRKMYYKDGRMTSEADYSKAASLL